MKQDVKGLPQLTHIQSKLRRIHTNRLQGVISRSKHKQVGINELPTYAHTIHEREGTTTQIANSYIEKQGQTVTGKQIYFSIRDNYRGQFINNNDVNRRIILRLLN